AADVGQAAVAHLVVEERRAVLPQRLVAVHAAAVVAEERLRPERHGLAGRATYLMTYLYSSSLSACSSSLPKRMSLSAWPAVPTSWCCISVSMPTAMSCLTISDRRSV